MSLGVERLNKNRIKDFYAIHSEIYGQDWCFCVGWWVESWEGWGERSASENLELREEIFAKGIFDGYLLYKAGTPIGWAQCGPESYYKKIQTQFELASIPNTYVISCIFIIPDERGQKYSEYFIGEIISDLEEKEVDYIHAFPKQGENLSTGEMWNGNFSVFHRLGFDILKSRLNRTVMEKSLRKTYQSRIC